MSIANNINLNELSTTKHTNGSGLTQAEVFRLRQ